MTTLILIINLFFSFASASVLQLSMPEDSVKVQSADARGFNSIVTEGFELSKKVGEPELPVKSILVVGKPEDIKVDYVASGFTRSGIKPIPVQEQPCRCASDKKRVFRQDLVAYQNETLAYHVEYLGQFRGQPISRLDVYMAQYQPETQTVKFFSNMRVNYSAKPFSMKPGTYNDYLIVVPTQLKAGVQDFAAWKQSQGYNVIIEEVQTPQKTLKGIAALIAQNYKDKGTDFVLMIGDEDTLPMHNVSTSGGTTTTDIKYFTLDGSGDNIPDVFYGRIPATTVDEVRIHLEKFVNFDNNGTKDKFGVKRVIGIASNEGSNPSDDEYVRSIEEKLGDVYSYQSVHYYQDDKKSNPQQLNSSFDQGAAWLFYMGHGSGDSWPSMYRSYSVDDIPQIINSDKIKPIIIDVACMNGRLLPGYLGTTFTDTTTAKAHGATAYYGGTVNISWHPPAVMARGIAYEHASKNFKHLGEALLAGQLYLAANWNDSTDVQDNFEWYHLQGDPSMLIQE